jgi:hypothetical protein
MLDKIRLAIATVVAFAHNVWTACPIWLQAFLQTLIVTLVALGQGFAWHFPADWSDAVAQVSAFWILAVPVAYQLFRTMVQPYLIPWLMEVLRLLIVPPMDLPPLRAGQTMDLHLRWYVG